MVTHFTYCCIRSKREREREDKKLVAQKHDLHSDVVDSQQLLSTKCRDVTTTCYWGCLVGVPDLPSSICSLCLRWNTSTWQMANAMTISHVGIFVQLHNKNNLGRIQFLNEWVKCLKWVTWSWNARDCSPAKTLRVECSSCSKKTN
jgi:hypothetical protein